MPTETKARAPRKAPVKTAVEKAAPTRKPRAKKTVARAVAAPPRIAFPRVANRFSGGFMRFAHNLLIAAGSVLSMASQEAVLDALIRKGAATPRHAYHSRTAGARAHRNWRMKRAAGRA